MAPSWLQQRFHHRVHSAYGVEDGRDFREWSLRSAIDLSSGGFVPARRGDERVQICVRGTSGGARERVGVAARRVRLEERWVTEGDRKLVV